MKKCFSIINQGNLRINLILVFLILMGSIKTQAQQYFFQNFNTENGLIQSQSLALAQDKLNRLWIGTFGGLSIFDGTSFLNYGRADGLENTKLYSIDFSSDGAAWIGTSNGLTHFDGHKFENYAIPNKSDSSVVSTVKVDNRNRVWLVTQNGAKSKLFLFENGKFLPQTLENDYLIALLKNSSGVIHIVYYKKGIFKNEHDAWQAVIAPPKDPIYCAAFSPDNSLYFVDKNGISKLRDSRTERVVAFPSSTQIAQIPVGITVDNKNKIWLRALDGTWLWTSEGRKHLTAQNGFTDDQVLDVLPDNFGNVWLGTNGSGIYKYSESPFVRFDSKMLPNARSISTLYRKGNDLVTGSTFLGIYNLDIRTSKVSKINFPSYTSYFNSLFINSREEIYYSTPFESGVFNTVSYKKHQFSSNNQGAIWHVFKDTAWVVGAAGLFQKSGNELELRYRSSGIKDFCQTANGNMLLLQHGRVFVFDPSSNLVSDSIVFPKGTQANIVVSNRNSWIIGTEDRGILIYEFPNQTPTIIDQQSGLTCNYVYNLLLDRDGKLWAGTGCGIDKISFGENSTFSIRSFGSFEGLVGAESNFRASYQDEEGDIWFGTTKGLFKYQAGFERQKATIPVVTLTSLLLFSKAIESKSGKDSLLPFSKIPYRPVFENDENSLTFSFRAICLSAPEKINYRYQLIGAETKFTTSKLTSVTYNQLAPGKYTFVVYASDEDGNWHENAYRYSFTIKALFYQTYWFKTLALVISSLLILFLIYKYSRSKEARRQREVKLREEEQNKVRQRTAADFHDEIGNKITRINLLTMMAEKKSKDNKDVQPILQQIRENTQSLYHGSKDIIWALQQESNYLKEAILRIQQNAISIVNESDVRLVIEEEPAIKEEVLMPLDYGRNLILIFKEAINNALKYSKASVLTLRFYEDIDSSIVLELEDNGIGYDVNEAPKGNGLKNIETRANAIKARCSFHSEEGRGTLIRIRMFKYSFNQ